jgi:S1-C subfamily serine protease
MSLFFTMLLACAHTSDARRTAGFVSVKEVIVQCENESEDCTVRALASSGTATRIVWNGDFYWLTAAHVCSSSGVAGGVSVAREMVVVEGGTGNADQIDRVTMNEKSDLCLMDASPGPARKIAKRSPALGDSVYALAYPGGVFVQNALPMYDGRFSGNFPGGCITTIPVAGGSSGAGIINRKGELIGVVSAVMRTFSHFAISACLAQVQEFVGPASQQNKSAGAGAYQTEQGESQESAKNQTGPAAPEQQSR